MEHYRVRKNKKDKVTVDDEEYFFNLVTLVQVSTSHHHTLTPSPHTLPSHPPLTPSPHTLTPSQHYQKDADGLCCRLRFSVDKTGDIEQVANMDDFISQGWYIPKSEVTKKSLIGKGEFGGTFENQAAATSQTQAFSLYSIHTCTSLLWLVFGSSTLP